LLKDAHNSKDSVLFFILRKESSIRVYNKPCNETKAISKGTLKRANYTEIIAAAAKMYV
jgi:hypothetical protein